MDTALLVMKMDKTLASVDLTTGHLSTVVKVQEPPTGSWIMVEKGNTQQLYWLDTDDCRICQVDMQTGESHVVASVPDVEQADILLCCTGDGKLLFTTHNGRCVSMWDSNRQAPSLLFLGSTEPDPDHSFDTDPCYDSWCSNPALFTDVYAAGIDARGRLWFLGAYTSLVPPYRLSKASQHISWELGGGTSSLTTGLGRLLHSGQHADVQLLLAGGTSIPAHALVLRTTCEWFEARLDRHSGGLEGQAVVAAAAVAAGSSSSSAAASSPAYVVDLTEKRIPVALTSGA